MLTVTYLYYALSYRNAKQEEFKRHFFDVKEISIPLTDEIE